MARMISPACPGPCPTAPAPGHPSCELRIYKHLRCERDDAHEALVAQLAADRAEDAGPAGLLLVVDEHGGVLVEADVAAVGAALLLLGAHDDALDDVALLDRGAGDGVLDGGHEDVADEA